MTVRALPVLCHPAKRRCPKPGPRQTHVTTFFASSLRAGAVASQGTSDKKTVPTARGILPPPPFASSRQSISEKAAHELPPRALVSAALPFPPSPVPIRLPQPTFSCIVHGSPTAVVHLERAHVLPCHLPRSEILISSALLERLTGDRHYFQFVPRSIAFVAFEISYRPVFIA